MPNINIAGTIVPFPDSGSSPNWAPAVIEAIQLIAQALQISAGPFDIPPQNYVMTANVNTNVPIPNLSFPVTDVSGAIVFYNVGRATNSVVVSQSGFLMLNYDSSRGPGLKWQVTDQYTNSGAQIVFNMTDVGQMQFSTTSIAGTGHTGHINFRGLAVLNS